MRLGGGVNRHSLGRGLHSQGRESGKDVWQRNISHI